MQLVDIKALSTMLSVKPKTIYDWVHKDYIPHIKLGQLVRFDENEIKEWLENKKSKKPTATNL
jgi:excisionase family DNA binding protein